MLQLEIDKSNFKTSFSFYDVGMWRVLKNHDLRIVPTCIFTRQRKNGR